MTGATLSLMAVVFVAFAIEASIGFGATLVTVAVGSLLVPIGALLPAFVPANLVLSAYMAARYHADVDGPMLGRRILPAMLAGLPVGLVATSLVSGPALERAFAVFVVVLALTELWRLRPLAPAPGAPIGRAASLALLGLGGVVHGAFATGGPLAVYVAGRSLGDDKRRFRATLSTLWLVLNGALLVSYVSLGRIGRASLETSVALALPLGLGIAAGEALHARIPMRTFRIAVFVLLGVAGVVLFARA